MIQKLSQLKQVVAEFQHFMNGSGAVQKIYSTTRYICITIRFRGATRYLYLGRGKGYEGVYIGDSHPPASLRVQDRFLEYLRSHVKSLPLVKLEADDDDRILSLHLLNRAEREIFMLFWAGRQLYFLHHFRDQKAQEWEVFCSWSGNHKLSKCHEPSELKKYFYEMMSPLHIHKDESKIESVATTVPAMKELLHEEAESLSHTGDKKATKFLDKKRGKILKDLEKNRVWNNILALIQQEGLDLTQMESFIVENIEIKFHKESHHYQRLDLVYQKVKKLKKGEFIQLQRLEAAEKDIYLLKNKPEIINIDRKKIIQPVWWKAGSKENDKNKDKNKNSFNKNENENGSGSGSGENRPWAEFFLGPVTVAIGKNAEGNDQLRSKWASKENLWFHIDGFVSAHAIIKTDQMAELTQEQLSFLASAMADYSHLELMMIPLIYTQVKNIKGVKGKAGSVNYTKQKYLAVPYVENWQKYMIKKEGK